MVKLVVTIQDFNIENMYNKLTLSTKEQTEYLISTRALNSCYLEKPNNLTVPREFRKHMTFLFIFQHLNKDICKPIVSRRITMHHFISSLWCYLEDDTLKTYPKQVSYMLHVQGITKNIYHGIYTQGYIVPLKMDTIINPCKNSIIQPNGGTQMSLLQFTGN